MRKAWLKAIVDRSREGAKEVPVSRRFDRGREKGRKIQLRVHVHAFVSGEV